MKQSELHIGDKVFRPVYMDDGTWSIEGDDCLASSPTKKGIVANTEIYSKVDDRIIYEVIWENGKKKRYLRHGIRKCKAA